MTRGLITVNPVSSVPTSSPAQAGTSASAAWSDWLGMVASIGCAIHCAAMPFVIAYLPALGLGFLADEGFHKWMAIGCFAIAVTAFIPGLRKHRRWTPVIVGSLGLLMISIAAFGFAGECCVACGADSAPVASTVEPACTDGCCANCESEGRGNASVPAASSSNPTTIASAPSIWGGRIAPFLTPVGGIILVCAHLLNRRYGCLCGCCGSDVAEATA